MQRQRQDGTDRSGDEASKFRDTKPPGDSSESAARETIVGTRPLGLMVPPPDGSGYGEKLVAAGVTRRRTGSRRRESADSIHWVCSVRRLTAAQRPAECHTNATNFSS